MDGTKHRADQARPPRPASSRKFATMAALSGSLTATALLLHYVNPPQNPQGLPPVEQYPIMGNFVVYEYPPQKPPATAPSAAKPASSKANPPAHTKPRPVAGVRHSL